MSRVEPDVRVLVSPDRHQHGLRPAELLQLGHEDVPHLDQRGEVEAYLPLAVDGPEHVVGDAAREYRREPHDPELLALLVDDGLVRVEPEREDVGHVLDRYLRALGEREPVVVVGLDVRDAVEDGGPLREGLEVDHVVCGHLRPEVEVPGRLDAAHHGEGLVVVDGVEDPPEVPVPEVDRLASCGGLAS